MNCTVHQQKEASGACVYCGKLFCEACLVELDGKNYCKEHVQQIFKERQGASQESARYHSPEPMPEYPPRSDTQSHEYPPRPQEPPRPHDMHPRYSDGYPGIVINNNNTNTNTNQNPYGGYHEMFSPKDRVVTLLLCLFFGIAGFHRFYAGKIGTGLLWLFTGGFFFIGYIVDLLMIIFGSFRDSHGLRIR